MALLKNPISAIALAFIGVGTLFTVDLLVSIANGHGRIQILSALLPLGIALLMRRNLARKLSAVSCALGTIVFLVMALLAAFGNHFLSFYFNNFTYAVSRAGSFIILIAISAIFFYCYIELTLPHVVQQFSTRRRAT